MSFWSLTFIVSSSIIKIMCAFLLYVKVRSFLCLCAAGTNYYRRKQRRIEERAWS